MTLSVINSLLTTLRSTRQWIRIYPSKKLNGRGFEKISAQGIISSIHGNNASSESRFGSERIFIYERPEERPTDIVAHNGTSNEGGEGYLRRSGFGGEVVAQ